MSAQAQASAGARLIKYLAQAFKGPIKRRAGLPPRAQQLIQSVRDRRLTYCGPPKLECLCDAMALVQDRGVAGCYVEAGCALGGSAIVIGSLKPQAAPLYVFDVFGLIPAPTANDGPDSHARYAEIQGGCSPGIRGDTYYGYVPNLREVVEQNLVSFGLDLERQRIRLIPGLFQETLHVAEPVALAHIDCDWYDSVQVCIERLAPRLERGGVMIFDDYSSYSGCRRAVDEWLRTSIEFRLVRVERSATVERVSGKSRVEPAAAI